ncbi:myosin light chain kinase, smooth muscle [Stegastes partitus]|uniref:Myosin light chain kinase, smooth muscle n=1 Tax=Stegastes partitus TaxID=144197 RepID=A0A9Y4NT94_9TELE|nr:PREDICTED: myosin light chain kinase, smooth muscle [Stegastes partitus]
MSDVRLAAASSTVSTVAGCSSHGYEPPAFILPPRNARVVLGGDARLEGKVRGHPEPQVTWYRQGRAVIGGERCLVERGGRGTFSLMVGGVTEEDVGRYTCQATNQAGSRQVTVEILLEEPCGRSSVLPFCLKPGCRSAVNRPGIWSESPPRFITKPSRVLAKLGQSGKFTAKATGRPQPRVTWYKEEAELQSGGRVRIYELAGLHLLEIKEVCAEDAGSYRCSVTSSAGSATAIAELSIQGEPTNHCHHVDPPEDSQTRTRSPAASVPSAPSSPGQTAAWGSRPPAQLPLLAERRSAAVQVQPVGPDPVQTGSVQQQPAGSGSSRAVRRSTSGSNLRFEAVPLDQEATEGTQVVFTCQVSSDAVAVVTWLRGGDQVRTGQQRQDGSRLTLTMERVRQVDRGTYRCQLTTADGLTVSSATWRLRVHGRRQGGRSEVTALCEAPRFIRGLTDLKVMDGSRVAMTVELSGHPPPDVVWLHDGQEVKESEDFQLLREEGCCTMLIQEVFPEDTGTYSCQAWNQYGEDRTEARLTVEEPQDGVQPWFITKPKALSAVTGHHVLLSCAIAGDPFPQYTWTRADRSRPLTSGGDFEVLRKEDVVSLLIRRVKQHHAGDYVIRLRNSVGECSAVARLSVSGPAGHHTRTDRRKRNWEYWELWDEEEDEEEEDECVLTLLFHFVYITLFILSLCSSICVCAWTPSPAGGAAGGGAAGGGGEEQRGSSRALSQQEEDQEPCEKLHQVKKKEEDQDSAAPRGLLRHCVETRERGEEELRQREAQQLDFRSLLGRRAFQNIHQAEEPREAEQHQMDFKANLKGVKPKAEEKTNSSPQVDFRSVLGKKGAAGSNGNKPADTPGKNAADFRSVLANKKKPAGPEKNGESGKVNNNCVDGGINEKKSAAGGGPVPEFVEKLSDVTVLDGQRLQLQCRLAAADATVSWTLDGKLIKPSKFIVLANEGGLCSLTIDKALPEDEGQYKCRAENPAGRAECSCTVLVDDPAENSPADKKSKKATPTSESEARIKKPTAKTPPKQALPPQILQFPEDMKILAGEKVEILCKFSGAPPINCTWLKFRKPIQGSADISISSSDSSSKLTISSGQQEHCGCYTIELRNSFGLRQAALNLTIVDKPDPPAKVPAASDIRRSSLTLSWYGPTYDGGSAVQSYNLEIWDSVEQQWKHLVSCNSTSYNVQNLLPERQYKFRVRAENIYGVGEPSAESEPVTVGLVDDGENLSDLFSASFNSEKEPDYRDVTIRTDVKVKELYDVEERLGTGKFGQVFKLVEKATKKVWAGKFIKAYSAKEKENVRQEIGIMNSLHHPKLVQCIDAFEGKSDIVMVLEIVSSGLHLVQSGSLGRLSVLRLSGLSPFMGDNDNETLSNVTSATWDFEDEAFDEISDNGKDFITNLLKKDMKARLTCAQCFEHTWLKQDTNTMKAKKLSKERMKKYILRRKWQKTGHAVRAIGRLSSMAMMAGVSAKKGSPTEEDNQFLECLEYEQKTECKPTFSSVIKDVEVVEGSAARFDCKIEGYPDPEVVWYKDEQPIKETRHYQIDYDEEGNCSLVISEVSGDDDSKYTVKAVNSLGEATCTAELLVEVMAGEEEEEEEEEE